MDIFKIFPECPDTEQILEWQVLRERLGSIFYQLTEESNPVRLGEKRKRYLCAVPSPHKVWTKPLCYTRFPFILIYKKFEVTEVKSNLSNLYFTKIFGFFLSSPNFFGQTISISNRIRNNPRSPSLEIPVAFR